MGGVLISSLEIESLLPCCHSEMNRYKDVPQHNLPLTGLSMSNPDKNDSIRDLLVLLAAQFRSS